MRDLGITATEFGPDDFLPDDPKRRAELLASYGLRAVGGFLPLVLHDPDHDPLPRALHTLDRFAAAGADTLVVAAASTGSGYDERDVVDGSGWATLFANLGRVAEAAGERGVQATLHPHVGTVIENRDEVLRTLDADMPLCLDTGHLFLGGTDPLELVASLGSSVSDRIAHVHLKDVDIEVAGPVRTGTGSFTDAVRKGVFRPLGAGGVDIGAVVRRLAETGYRGWYVLEQDRVLSGEPGPNGGPAPDVRTSLEFLAGVWPR
ncbi:MAG: TIM barrel protein [Streptosporangiales bacterium]|nr:TIM barrel protein [Streptosporangiales bacterium]